MKIKREGIKESTGYFCFLCWMVYFTSYLTRINFAAVISEIVQSDGFLKSQLGIVTTASFISYGIGQVVSGIMGDRIKPKTLIMAGLCATSVLNTAMPFCRGIGAMTVVWCVNGFAQAMLWPPLHKIMTMRLDAQRCKKAVVDVSIASAVATITIYITSPLFIYLWGWRSVFFVSAVAGAITAALWYTGIGEVKEREVQTSAPQGGESRQMPFGRLAVSSGLIFIALAIVFQGILRDGITTWMPSFISENFNLGASISILTTVILPVFAMISLKGVAFLHKRFFRDEVLFAAAIFIVSLVGCVMMVLFYRSGVAISLFLSAVITGCMHGANLMLIGMIPPRFLKTGRLSTVSGTLNSMTYVGSALSSYGFARISESFGWNATLVLWCVVAACGAAMCFAAYKKWKTFRKDVLDV